MMTTIRGLTPLLIRTTTGIPSPRVQRREPYSQPAMEAKEIVVFHDKTKDMHVQDSCLTLDWTQRKEMWLVPSRRQSTIQESKSASVDRSLMRIQEKSTAILVVSSPSKAIVTVQERSTSRITQMALRRVEKEIPEDKEGPESSSYHHLAKDVALQMLITFIIWKHSIECANTDDLHSQVYNLLGEMETSLNEAIDAHDKVINELKLRKGMMLDEIQLLRCSMEDKERLNRLINDSTDKNIAFLENKRDGLKKIRSDILDTKKRLSGKCPFVMHDLLRTEFITFTTTVLSFYASCNPIARLGLGLVSSLAINHFSNSYITDERAMVQIDEYLSGKTTSFLSKRLLSSEKDNIVTDLAIQAALEVLAIIDLPSVVAGGIVLEEQFSTYSTHKGLEEQFDKNGVFRKRIESAVCHGHESVEQTIEITKAVKSTITNHLDEIQKMIVSKRKEGEESTFFRWFKA